LLESRGGIARRMRLFRMPDTNTVHNAKFSRRIERARAGADDALYICVTLEDGHRIWSSPIYLLS
jgi:hypothetical protein